MARLIEQNVPPQSPCNERAMIHGHVMVRDVSASPKCGRRMNTEHYFSAGSNDEMRSLLQYAVLDRMLQFCPPVYVVGGQ